MSKILFFILIFKSFNAFSLETKTEVVASVSFFKDATKPFHIFEIEHILTKSQSSYQLALKDLKKKNLTQEQALHLKSKINDLIWDFKYKHKKETKECKKIYALLKVADDSVNVCTEDKREVSKTFSLLNRLNSIVK